MSNRKTLTTPQDDSYVQVIIPNASAPPYTPTQSPQSLPTTILIAPPQYEAGDVIGHFADKFRAAERNIHDEHAKKRESLETRHNQALKQLASEEAKAIEELNEQTMKWILAGTPHKHASAATQGKKKPAETSWMSWFTSG